MLPDSQPTPSREGFAALSPQHAAFAEAGGYEALRAIHRITGEQGLSYALALDLSDSVHASGRVTKNSSLEVQSVAMAARGDLENLLSALAAYFCVPVGVNGDGDTTPEPTEAG